METVTEIMNNDRN